MYYFSWFCGQLGSSFDLAQAQLIWAGLAHASMVSWQVSWGPAGPEWPHPRKSSPTWLPHSKLPKFALLGEIRIQENKWNRARQLEAQTQKSSSCILLTKARHMIRFQGPEIDSTSQQEKLPSQMAKAVNMERGHLLQSIHLRVKKDISTKCNVCPCSDPDLHKPTAKPYFCGH